VCVQHYLGLSGVFHLLSALDRFLDYLTKEKQPKTNHEYFGTDSTQKINLKITKQIEYLWANPQRTPGKSLTKQNKTNTKQNKYVYIYIHNNKIYLCADSPRKPGNTQKYDLTKKKKNLPKCVR